MCEFITPILLIEASNKKTNKVLVLFYTMPEYAAWKEKLGNKAT